MSSNEGQPLLQDDDWEERQSRMRRGYHGIAVDISYDNSTRRQTRRFLSSIYGHYAVLLLVSMDVGCIFADFLISLYICDHSCGKGQSVGHGLPRAQDALGIVGLVFSCLFMVELLASIWAFGLSFFKSKFHCFDAIIIVAGFIIDVCLKDVLEEAASIVVILRLWRVFKIVEEFSAGASDQMEVLGEKIEKLEAENQKLKRELKAWKADDSGHFGLSYNTIFPESDSAFLFVYELPHSNTLYYPDPLDPLDLQGRRSTLDRSFPLLLFAGLQARSQSDQQVFAAGVNMGQTLSEPVVEKISDDGQDDRVAFGVSAMQGWRISMEDAHAAVLDLQTEDADKGFVAATPEDRLSFFGVYDGHGGDKVALFAGENIHKILAKQEAFKKKDFEQALKDGFLATDRAILDDPKYEEEVSGCTASVGLISKTTIYVGNAGDSRSVLGVKGRAKPLSYDHKPQNEGEKARICAAGGFVDFGRVNGNLALSRAIGDFEFKKSAQLSPEQQIVTAFPDVISHTITDDDEFLVIACDGIWDCQSSQAVVEFVRRGIAAKQELSKISENMMDNCLASNSETGGVGCDNMTMIVIALLRGKSKDEWYEEIGARVAKGDGPCAPPEYAEFRGPGMRQNFEDSGDDYDLDADHRNRGVGGRSDRIILLGDGTEVLTDSDETEMFDHEEEDKDLASQASKGQKKLDDTSRGGREETPGPESHGTSERQQTPESMEQHPFDTPSSTTSEKSSVTDTAKASIKAIPESALPEKLVTPPISQGKN